MLSRKQFFWGLHFIYVLQRSPATKLETLFDAQVYAEIPNLEIEETVLNEESMKLPYKLYNAEVISSVFQKASLLWFLGTSEMQILATGAIGCSQFRIIFHSGILSWQLAWSTICGYDMRSELNDLTVVRIRCKDFRMLFLGFTDKQEAKLLLDKISTYWKVPLYSRFCFTSADPESVVKQLYDPGSELIRQGYSVNFGLWYILSNNDFELCSSYPNEVIVPTEVTCWEDEEIDKMTSVWELGRFPIYCWGQWNQSQPGYGAVLLYSSRPVFDSEDTSSSAFMHDFYSRYIEAITLSVNIERPYLKNDHDSNNVIILELGTALKEDSFPPNCKVEREPVPQLNKKVLDGAYQRFFRITIYETKINEMVFDEDYILW